MRAELLSRTLKALFPIQRVVSVEGPPGGGKTSIIRQVAAELGVHYIEKHMPTMLVEDFGTQWPDEGDTLRYKLPDWFPAKGSRYDDGRGGILCFDDRNQANADLQKVLANICQARNLHGTPLADGWQVVSTGNRQSDRAGANRVLSHLRNRETVLELETHLDDTTKHFVAVGAKPEVISFLRFRPGLLHDFDPQRDSNPSPRSWLEGVDAVIGVVPHDAEYEAFKGAVGEGPAAEFVGYMRIFRELPDPDSIIANPTEGVIPSNPATLFALAGAVSYRATVDNFKRVCTYADRLPPEFSVLLVSLSIRKNPDLCNTEAYASWVIKHQDVLF